MNDFIKLIVAKCSYADSKAAAESAHDMRYCRFPLNLTGTDIFSPLVALAVGDVSVFGVALTVLDARIGEGKFLCFIIVFRGSPLK